MALTSTIDLAHQIDVLELCARRHAEQGRTLVAVLHDLNQAARHGTHMIALRGGAVVATGPPVEVVTEELIAAILGLDCRVVDDPETGTPTVVPRHRVLGASGPTTHGSRTDAG